MQTGCLFQKVVCFYKFRFLTSNWSGILILWAIIAQAIWICAGELEIDVLVGFGN
jgi:hypothetical protein